jgi:hypothetical protein
MNLIKQLIKDERGDALQFVIIAAACIGLVWMVYRIAKPYISNYTESYGNWLDTQGGSAPE